MLKRFGLNKPSSGLKDGKECCLNNDGCFYLLSLDEGLKSKRLNIDFAS